MNDKTKLFSLSEVFCFQRGERLTEADQTAGDIAYISSTKMNNGISAYVQPPDSMTVHNNRITLSNSGSVGYCFYHQYDFVASDHVTVIWIKDENVSLNANIALYLKPVFESMRYKYSFGREIKDERLEKELVLLPSVHGDPDWNSMELHTQQLRKTIKWSKLPSTDCPSLSFSNREWFEFEMDKIFVIKRGRRLVKSDMRPGKTHFIGAISANNGVRQLIDEEPLHDGNCITVNYNGSVGEAFYQEQPFWASDDVNILYPQEWWDINRNIALFIVAVIKENRYLFSYGRKWTFEKMKRTKLKLPVKDDGAPDFAFMENYIQALPYAHYL
jgi:hypothetical protein